MGHDMTLHGSIICQRKSQISLFCNFNPSPPQKKKKNCQFTDLPKKRTCHIVFTLDWLIMKLQKNWGKINNQFLTPCLLCSSSCVFNEFSHLLNEKRKTL